MRHKNPFIIFFLLLCYFSTAPNAFGQTKDQKALEAKKISLEKEIKDMNRLLSVKKRERGAVLEDLETANKKIKVREQLIRLTNQQANLLTRQINANQKEVKDQQKALADLKKEYAQMIQKSYLHTAQENRLLFLLSSKSFYMAYKRLQYLKQYQTYRKKQGEGIAIQTKVLEEKIQSLNAQRKAKEALVLSNTAAKKQLLTEKQNKAKVLQDIRQNERKYTAAIRKKQKEAKALENRIEALIKAAIAAANKKAKGVKGGASFLLTPEATRVANNFTANKGKLIWPLEKGLLKRGYGVYSDPVYPGIKHQNNGVTIATEKGSQARAIFEGEVIAIMAVPGGNLGVQIKHGNFISTYYNLKTLGVKKGDFVQEKQSLGEIASNDNEGQTILKFYLYQNSTRLNPQEWVFNLR
ncbi:peptidoglycan DD-metalloendopeptidase family protein [Flavobacteriaceae bacterium]|jgi:septal ring factor EnvC (AmiA/AmiB activator)|nr:MAG: peptidase M23 [Polaribacter sp. BACL8 MAG-120419-bin8]MBT4839714.1 peptidoglycan DD-metalloendopeptidase family protein [Flavobacteriaceae bacterium]MBT5584808.1 peptidoglycan DD-metalloendopeptidase family protein [Flavobacteriaceae bacterium]MBT5921735.1 peptidoglycan DD-metalloendopeptidase family protein [Flavobacteriaceae bacterium]MDA8810768.1 peptidoglycan DD-metalloendopeptidase family protein [Flavobacteriaceae bacterium]